MEYLDIYDRVGDKFVHKGTMEKEEVVNRGEWHKIVGMMIRKKQGKEPRGRFEVTTF